MSAAASHIRCLQSQFLTSRSGSAPQAKTRKREVLAPLILFFVLALQLWVRVESISIGYEVESFRREALRNDNELRELKLRYALLERPDFLRERAKRRLGMSISAPQRVRKIIE